MSRTFLLGLAWVALSSPVARGADWPAFRGPRGTGISQETNLPTTWNQQQNVRWKAALPGPGNSSPIVSQGRVFVTCATDQGKSRELHCFDRRDGTPLWMHAVRLENLEPTHDTNPYCGSTPASDGQRVVVWHGSAGLYCYDHAGKLLWSRELGEFRHIWGYGSSPVFHDNVIYANCGPGKRSFVIALDAHDGHTIWQADEPGDDGEKNEQTGEMKWTGSWSTPIIAQIQGQVQVIVSQPQHVQAHDPKDGRVLWSVDGLGDLVYTSALIGDEIGVAMGGYHGPAIGFKLGGSGNVTQTNRLWRSEEQIPQRIGSGVILGEHIFMANEPGIMQCLELKTGRELWRDRLPGGSIWGSLLWAQDRLYVTNQDGTTIVLAPNPRQLEVLAANELGEASNATPAFSDGQIFLRTVAHLYCIAE